MSDLARTLDFYLTDDISNQAIKDDWEGLGYQNVLGFFHLFYRWIDLIAAGQPLEAIAQLESLNLPGGVTALIAYHLLRKFRSTPMPGFPPPELGPNETSLLQLDREYERLKQLYPPDIYAQDDPSDVSRSARFQLWGHYMVEDVVYKMLERAIKESEAKRAFENQIRQSEQERMREDVEKIAQEVLKSVKQPKQNPEFTTNRQVIALGFILRRLGVSNIDKKVQGNFIEFLTGKNNKEIYDRVRELDETVYNKSGKDAEYVSAWFQKLGLTDLAKEIDSLLSKRSEDF